MAASIASLKAQFAEFKTVLNFHLRNSLPQQDVAPARVPHKKVTCVCGHVSVTVLCDRDLHISWQHLHRAQRCWVFMYCHAICMRFTLTTLRFVQSPLVFLFSFVQVASPEMVAVDTADDEEGGEVAEVGSDRPMCQSDRRRGCTNLVDWSEAKQRWLLACRDCADAHSAHRRASRKRKKEAALARR